MSLSSPYWIFHPTLPRELEHQGHSGTYPTGIEYAGMGHTLVKQVIIQNLCTYPSGIVHVDTSYKTYAHIPRELNMQAQ